MSTKGIIGTLTIKLTEGEDLLSVASLLSANLSVQTEMRQAFEPAFVPGVQGWRADASVIQLVDSSTGDRERYLAYLEEACIAKASLPVLFESPTGAEYSSEAFIDTFQLGGAEGEVFSGSFGVQGIAELVLEEPE